MNLWEAVQKYFWIINLVFLAVAAYLSANIAGSVVHRKLVAVPKVDLADLKIQERSTSKSMTYYQPILDRNIFDSTAVASDDEEDDELALSNLSAELLGTIAAAKPEDSLAIIRDKNKNTIDTYAIGENISGAQVLSIGRGEVVILRNGKEERLTLPDITTVTASTKGGGARMQRTTGAGIVNQGGDIFTVDSKVIEDSLADMSSLLTQARIVPHMNDGKIDGFKIYNIKSDSLFKKIGMRNGDVIRRINGMEVNSPEQGLQVFETLRSERNINIDLTRRGSNKTLNYTIQ